ncbi:Protein of unknown function [Bacillus cytotoxicus]|nr:Protein of unknown function [Bacillus cytotoxicus]
MKLLCNDNG